MRCELVLGAEVAGQTQRATRAGIFARVQARCDVCRVIDRGRVVMCREPVPGAAVAGLTANTVR